MNSGNTARILATRVVMMPRDTQGHGNISGGVLLKNIDLAGALIARRACNNRVIKRMVTRAMDNIEFKQPVHVSDVLTCYGYVLRIGKTSITVQVEVEVDRFGETIAVTDAQLTFVAIDNAGRPTPIETTAPATATPTDVTPPAVASDSAAIAAATAVVKSHQHKKAPKKAAERTLSVRITMMPSDTNGMGNIFGGVLLDLMDHAGAYVAKRACSNQFIDRCATRAMGKVEFKQPVHVNDVLSVYGVVTGFGTTSISVHVEAEVERQGEVIPVTAADLVYVAVDEKGVKTPITCGITAPARPQSKGKGKGQGGRKGKTGAGSSTGRKKRTGGGCNGGAACSTHKH